MAGKWQAYVPNTLGERDKPRVVRHDTLREWLHPTRKAAIAVLRRELERQHKAALERAAETGRALANLLELERA